MSLTNLKSKKKMQKIQKNNNLFFKSKKINIYIFFYAIFNSFPILVIYSSTRALQQCSTRPRPSTFPQQS